MKRIRVVIVDDQHLFAESLKYVIKDAGKEEIEIIGIAENGMVAIELIEKLLPDIVLMDVRMPVMDGVQATEILHKRHPEIKIMILTTFDDDDLVFQALTYGASGYVLKNSDPADLILAIRTVFSGAFYASASVGCKLVPRAKLDEGKNYEQTDLLLKVLSAHKTLTRREGEIICLLSQAYRNKEIADRLSISEKTVKNHLSSIFEKLDLGSRMEIMHLVSSIK